MSIHLVIGLALGYHIVHAYLDDVVQPGDVGPMLVLSLAWHKDIRLPFDAAKLLAAAQHSDGMENLVEAEAGFIRELGGTPVLKQPPGAP